ncbi:MAG: hypothetical protein DMF42_09470, partial [Verrucomicrobia bacterium]
DPLSEFRQGHFACYLVSLGPAFGLLAHRNVGSIPAGDGYLAKAQVRQPRLRDHEHFLAFTSPPYELRSQENCFRGLPN